MGLLALGTPVHVVCTLLGVYNLILLARVIFSYFRHLPEPLRPVARFAFVVTEPVVRLARPLIPPLRIGHVALDISILLIFFLILILRTGLGCPPFLFS